MSSWTILPTSPCPSLLVASQSRTCYQLGVDTSRPLELICFVWYHLYKTNKYQNHSTNLVTKKLQCMGVWNLSYNLSLRSFHLVSIIVPSLVNRNTKLHGVGYHGLFNQSSMHLSRFLFFTLPYEAYPCEHMQVFFQSCAILYSSH